MAKRRATAAGLQGGARLLGVLRRNRAALLLGTALQTTALLVVSLPAEAQPSPNARPMGGSVVAGAASISTPNATTTAINQSSQRAAINWQSFDVGSQQSVNFNQPSTSAITLNRVTGPDPSAIAGQIHANGQLVLTNPSGVVFYRGSQVNAQALVVSAPGITTKNFMAGNMVFDQPAKPGALVANAGTITVKQAGLAALVAPQVANSGTINARMGHVVLAGAEAQTVDLYGDGLMAIDVTKQVTQVPVGPNGKPVAALVTNTGLIRADGGTVQLTAAAADGIVQNLVDAGGRIQANSVGAKTGTISIAGTGGAVTVSGQVLATGRAPGSTGGQIEVNATGTARVTRTARIDASGQAGGGTVAIGTTLQRAIGGPSVTPTMTAAHTVVQHGARIAADARGRGNGGQVTLLSRGLTNFNGSISARGGATGGDGGNVELSGAGVSLHGTVDVTAPHGAMGNITLDPANLTITNTASNNGELTDNQDPNLAYNTPNTTTDASVSPAALEALHGNVHLQATDNLFVSSSVTLTTAGESLRLEAGYNLTVEPNVTIATAGNIVLSAATSTIPGFNAAGSLNLIRGAAVTTSDGSVTLSAGSAAAGSIGIRIDNSSVTASNGQTISLNADNFSVYGGALGLTVPNGVVAIAPTTAGRPVELINIGTFASGVLGVSQYEVGLMSAATLRLGSSTAGPISIGSGTGDHVVLNGIGSLSGGVGTLDLESGAGITEPGSFAVSTLTGIAHSAVLLGSISNTIATLGAFGAPAGFTLGNTGDIDITGAVNGGTGIAIQTQANGRLSAGNITVAAPLSATSVGLIGAGISETGIGVITAGTLTGSGTGINLGGANSIADLGALSSTSTLLLDNVAPLNVTGLVQATGLLSVTETGALTLANGGTFNAASVAVGSSGAFTETGNGAVVATALSGSASSVSLNGSANQVGSLAGFTTTAGNFSLTDSVRLNVTEPVSVSAGQTLSLFTDGLTIGPLGGSLTTAGSLSAPGGTIELAPFTANTPVLVYNIGSAASTGLSIPAGELASMSAATLQLGSASTSGVTIGNAGDLITIPASVAPTLAVLTNATGAVTEGGPLTVGTLTGSAGSLTFDYLNQVGTLGNFTTNTGLALTNGQTLTVAGTLTDNQGITLLVNNGDLTIANNLTAPSVDLYVNIGSGSTGNLVQSAGIISATSLYLNASGNITQSGGALHATTLTVPTAGGVSLTEAANSIVNLGSVSVYPGNFSLVDSRGLNVTGNAYVNGGMTLNVTGSLALGARMSTTGTIDLIATGAITEPNYGYLSGGVLTGSGLSAALTRPNSVGNLGDFTSTGGFSLTNRTGLSVTGTVGDGVGVSLTTGGSLALSGSITAPSIALTANNYIGDRTAPGFIIQTAGLLHGSTSVVMTTPGSIVQSGGTITTALLEANAPAGVSLTGPANFVTNLGSSSSAAGFDLANAQSLIVSGPVSDPPGVTLSAIGDLTISNAVSGPTVSLTATGAITETSTGSIAASTLLTGSSGAATTLGQIGNSVVNLGSFTAGTDFLLTDSVPLTVSGTVAAGAGASLTLNDNAPSLGAGSLLSAPGGLVVIAPATPNTAVALGTGSGIGAAPAVNAATLRIGSPTAGPISIAGSFNLAGATTLDLESASTIRELPPGSASSAGVITANTLIGSGSSATLTNANSITTLGSFVTTGGFALTNAAPLTVNGPVTDATGITLDVTTGALTLAGNIAAPTVLATSTSGPLTQQSGTLTGTLSVGLYGGAVTQTGGDIITNTLRSTGSTIALTGTANTVAGIGLLEASSGNVSFDDSTGFAITGTIGPLGSASAPGTIGLFAGGPITESTGGEIIAALLTGQAGSATLNQVNAVQSVGSFTSTGGFLLNDDTGVTLAGPLRDATSIAVTASGNIDVTGSVAAPGISLASNIGVEFPVGGTIVLAGTLAGGAVSLLGQKSIVQTGGVISATTLTGGSTFYGTSLTSPTNTIGSLGSFSSNGGFSLADTAPLAIIGNVSDPTSVSLAAQGAITQSAGSITTALLTGSGAGVQLTQPGNSVANLGAFTSTADFALTDAAPVTVSGSVVVGTGHTLTIADNAPAFGTGGSLIAAGGTVVLTPATAGAALTLGGGTGFGAGSAVSANTLQIGSASAGSITITGALDLTGASTLDLVSGATIAETGTGAIAAPTLIGSGTAATLNGANAITTLGSFGTTNGFSLTNAQSLTVAGPVTDATGITLDVTTGGLTLAGNLAAPNVRATSTTGPLTQQSGTLTGTLSVGLYGGAVTQTGGDIITNTLRSTGSTIALTGTANTVAGIGLLEATSGNVSFDDSSGFAIAGTIGPLGSLSAPGTVSLFAGGPITESAGGQVVAALLTGDAVSATLGQINLVQSVGSFTSTGGFALTDDTDVTLAGPLHDSTAVAVTTTGNIDLTGNVAAPGITLTANAIGQTPLGGTIVLAGTLAGGSVGLFGGRSIVQTGGLISAATLTGDVIFGGASLTGTANSIANLGSFSSDGGFALADSTALAIIGNVSDPTSVSLAALGAITQSAGSITTALLTGSGAGVQLAQPGNSVTSLGAFTSTADFALTDATPISVSGSVVVGTGHTLTLADDTPSFAAGGSLIAAGGTVVLAPATAGDALTLGGGTGFGAGSAVSANTLQIGSPSAGSITIIGVLDLTGASTLDLVSGSRITETGAGAIAAPTLIGSGSAAVLNGANAITTLGSFTTTDGFNLTNTTALLVNGPVTDAAGGVGLSLTPGSTPADLTLAGTISGPTIRLSDSNGGIVQTGGVVSTANGLYLIASGAITQSGGSLAAGTLQVTQSTGAGVSLTSAFNRVTNLGSVGSDTANFTLVDATGLNVVGPISGNVTLNANGSIAIAGPITAGQLDLIASGDVTQTVAGLTAATLTADVRSLTLGGAYNYIGTLGGIATSNGLTIRDHSVTVAGPISDAIDDPVGVSISVAGLLTVGGDITGPLVHLDATTVIRNGTTFTYPGVIQQSAGLIAANTQLVLTATGSMAQSGGSITTPLLTGSSGAAASLASTGNSIAALGSFASGGAFTLADGSGLAVTGAVTAPTVDLAVGGALTEPAGGSIATTLLTGSGASVVLGQIGNSIASLGAFASAGDFSLTDGAPIAVSGSVVAGTGHTLTIADNAPSFTAGGSLIAAGGTVVLTPATTGDALTLGGGTGFGAGSAVTANTLQIGSPSAGPITITGALDLTGASTLDLVSGAAIAETGAGAIAAPTLIGSGTAATLDGANAIATLGSFTTTSGFSLTNAQNLTVAGPVADGTTINLTVNDANLTLAGNVSATTIGLYATGASGTNTGSITQTGGSLTASFLAASGDNGVDLTGPANSIATLNSSQSANGPFALTDATGLVIAGYLGAATQLTLRAGGPITEGSFGGVSAATLTGSAISLALTTTGNYIGTLGNFLSTSGLSLNNAEGLTVAGSLSDGVGITLTSLGTLAVSGTLAAPDVSLIARNLTGGRFEEGAVTGQFAALAPGSYVLAPGVIVQNSGGIGASSLLTLIADSSIAQLGGTISAGTLTGSSGATTSLTAPGNSIAALGSFTSVGAFTLADTTSLAVIGTVVAPSLGVSVGGALTEPSGTLLVSTLSGSASSATLGQIANSISSLGSFSSAGDFSLTDGAPLAVTGSVTVGTGHTLTLADDAPSFAAGGSLIAAGGTVVLAPATANDALTLGGGSGFGAGSAVTANTLQIGSAIAGSLTITGVLDLTGAGTLDLVSGAAIAETGAGALAAPTLIGSGTAASLGGANAIGTLGSFATSNGFSLTNAQSLTVAGPVTDANTGVSLTSAGSLTLAGSIDGPAVTLVAVAGGISQTSGSIGAGVLTGSAGAAASFAGPNNVATLGSFTTPSDFLLTDTAPLTVAGPLSAATVTLNDNPGITFTGGLATGTLSVSTAQSVVQTAGTIDAVLLTGSAGTLAQFGPDAAGPVANIGTLGPFTVADGRLGLSDAAPLTVAGPVSANSLLVSAPGSIVLAGGTISTAGAPLDQQLGAEPAPTGSSITVLPGTDGAGQLLQTGTTTIAALGNGADTIRLQAPAAGSISFNDLTATTSNVVLATQGGTISGLIDVAGLTVLGQTGSATLTGIVNGIGGKAAAPLAAISPGVNAAYTINGCVIATTCATVVIPPQVTLFSTVFPTLEIPGELRPIDLFGNEAAELAQAEQFLLFGGLITFVPPRDLEDPDVMLPNISDRDY